MEKPARFSQAPKIPFENFKQARDLLDQESTLPSTIELIKFMGLVNRKLLIKKLMEMLKIPKEKISMNFKFKAKSFFPLKIANYRLTLNVDGYGFILGLDETLKENNNCNIFLKTNYDNGNFIYDNILRGVLYSSILFNKHRFDVPMYNVIKSPEGKPEIIWGLSAKNKSIKIPLHSANLTSDEIINAFNQIAEEQFNENLNKTNKRNFFSIFERTKKLEPDLEK